ncbi:hypothetical protein HYC85_031078 [Camellia sinensis]|uniref:Chlororespiratory reduction 42 n=1 Tax=Camellia sinensis TaxID=4442 RepID=A0A7J7FPX9_CAMSI|nr:hypothetical protein HYC85_031078 [Camellia sinensis]
MAFSLSCAATSSSSSSSSLSAWWIPQYLKHRNEDSFVEFKNCNPRQPKKKNVVLVGVSIFSIKSESKDYSSSSSSSEEESRRKSRRLEIGSPIIVTEAPKMIKTATAVPCLRLNSGLVNPGDVGRIVSRKPKDVWAVRLTIGTYLIDGKYFKPLDLED